MAKNGKKLGSKPAEAPPDSPQDAPEAPTLDPQPDQEPETQGQALGKLPTDSPDAPPSPEAPLSIPEGFRELAAAFAYRHKLPAAFLLAVAALESDFGRSCRGNLNVFGIRAHGTENRDREGWAWFHSYPEAFERFCLILTRRDPFPEAMKFACSGEMGPFALEWGRDEDYADKLAIIYKQMEGTT